MSFHPFFKSSENESAPNAELTSRERLLAAVVEHTPECVKLVDANGVLLDMNAAGLDLIEANSWESVKNANVYDLIATEHLEKFRQLNEKVCAGSRGSLEFEIVALRGTRRWMQTTAVPFKLPNGLTVQLAITRDITSDKMHQLELQQEKEKAEAANIAKSEFLANMSHEIRTPMTAIIGYADMLISSNSDFETVQSAETIKGNGSYLLEIMNDILDLSKIEVGKLDIEKVACSPRKILNEIYQLYRDRAKAEGLELEVLYEGSIPETIETDPLRLRQILINLVSNAIKFTTEGTVKLTASLDYKQQEGLGLEFEVSDTGIGIPKEDLKRIFNNFTQVDASTSRVYGGTGLGLAISKRLASILEGDIQVTSTLGEGSSFTLRLPTRDIKQDRMIRISDNASAVEVKGPTGAAKSRNLLSCRILLAEDGLDNQKLISQVLKNAGAKVQITDNGQAAYELAKREHDKGNAFDIILMDMQMPKLDGYQATEKLRLDGYSYPIIALTAHAMTGDRLKCLEAGCDDYFTKPIDFEILINSINQYATRSQTTSDQIFAGS